MSSSGNSFNFIWKIKNFSFFKRWEELEVPVFIGKFFNNSFGNSKLKLNISRKEYLSLNLSYDRRMISSDDTDGIIISVQFELVVSHGNPLKSEKTTRLIERGKIAEWFEFISFTKIFDNQQTYLPDDCLTIHISLSLFGIQTLFNLKRSMVQSVIEAKKSKINWTITQFSSMAGHKSFISFSSGSKCVLTTHSSKVYVSNMYETEFTCKVHLLDSRETRLELKMAKDKDNKQCWDIPSFVTDRSKYLINDILRLEFEIYFKSGTSIDVETNYEFEVLEGESDMCDTLQRSTLEESVQHMYDMKKLSDVTFQVEGKSLLAHKLILAARSSVFATMFEQDMLESRSGVIKIEDMEYDTIAEMLNFLYGKNFQKLTYERAIELMQAAEKYQIARLKEECSSFLKASFCETNVCQILAFSDLIQDKDLKGSAVDYLKYYKKIILNSDEWNDLVKTNIQLTNEVLTAVALTD